MNQEMIAAAVAEAVSRIDGQAKQQFMRAADVKRVFGCSDQFLKVLIENEILPPPIRIAEGKTAGRFWRVDEVDRAVERMSAEREQV